MDLPGPIAQNGGLADPSTDIYNRLLKERIVFLGQQVDDTVANMLTAQLLYLEGQDAERDIWLYINSPGGSVTAGMAIYDIMQFIECAHAPATPNNSCNYAADRIDWIRAYHNEGTNIAFWDGHAKWRKWTECSSRVGKGSGIYFLDGLDR